MPYASLFLLLLLPTCLFSQPLSFQSTGIGGGGALFSPAINPADDQEMYFASDLGGLYTTRNGGNSYELVHFTEAVVNPYGKVCFTQNTELRYALIWDEAHYATRPAKSSDGGNTWNFLPGDTDSGEEKLFLYTDYTNPNRVLWTDYNHLYYSADGGQTAQLKWTAANSGTGILLSGVFFNGNDIWLGTNEGVIVSHNGGGSFSNANFTGIPANEVIMGFGGGKSGNTTRFYALTGDPANIWATNMGYNYWQTIRGVYTMDNVSGAWLASMNGIDPDADYAVYLAMADNDPNTCYLAGSTPFEEAIVMKTANGGASWEHIYLRNNNQNIYTGYQGANGDFGYSWGGFALGFAVNRLNSQHAVLTDFGFIHHTLNGGVDWHQAYLQPADENPANTPTPKKKYYHGVGMEQTTCWQVYWFDANNIFGCFTDIRGVRSQDAGKSWSFDYTGHNLNTMYRIAKHNTQDIWYGATSSVHDIYQTTYITDQRLQPSYKDGQVLYSSDKGKNWSVLRDFDYPVIWVTTDPTDNDRLYAGVISTNPAVGGVWKAQGISNPSNTIWSHLPNPPANNGRIFNIHCLNDGTLVTTWSARKSNSGSIFSDSSGVFVSTDGGQNWQKRNHPDMNYWTKDLVIDPSDPTQNTWYACVWSGWGGPANDLGRLFRTTNRGLSWQAITADDQFLRVSSVTIDPLDPETMYLSSETNGLWVTHEKSAAQPQWSLVSSYPFQHPERVYFNPYKPEEMWIASFGNGMRFGSLATPVSEPDDSMVPVMQLIQNPIEDNQLKIRLQLSQPTSASFLLYDVQGRIVHTFGSQVLPVGLTNLDLACSGVPAGIYFVQMETPEMKAVEKVLIQVGN
ncbi:MAG TPA: T9SS type A sorting domain-containing protein [Saprospiraceae bacterium]|nr:T9SS type A sorting domain-containing protein [Saprospiraceae bacterium]